jgi:predicted ester cyclase
MPIPATGKPITVPGVMIFRVVEGNIVEDWYQIDNLNVTQQPGLLPGVG